jgi:hypothetical protein
MRIENLRKYQGKNPNGYFEDLEPRVKMAAYQWLGRLCQRWGRDLPPWRFAILVGRARWLALNPPTPEWGRSMRAKRGGYAVQRKYRLEGRHPTAKATEARLRKLRAKKQIKARQEEEQKAERIVRALANCSRWDLR